MKIWILCITMTLSLHLMGANQLDLNTVMTPGDRKNAGIDTLNPQQKQALEQWLTQWTLQLLNHPVEVQKSLSSSAVKPPQGALKIKYVTNGGAGIELEDGSYWQVFPIDISIASQWLPRDKIDISQSGNGDYPYQLDNNSTGKTIRAKTLAGYPNGNQSQNPQQQSSKADSDPWIPQQGLLLDVNQDNGRVLILNDGTVWNVSPNASFSTRLWLKGQRLSIGKNSNDQRYPYKITNLTTGEEIPVKP